MKIVALIGPSGTGKSYRALWVAKQKNLEYIIDDGLLISNNKVIAGRSAKKEATRVAAIRRACFQDPKHVSEVKEAIKDYKPKSILIIATSAEMAQVISNALKLGKINEEIPIDEVATQQEIDRALQIRGKEGKHVIPVPTFEIKKTFSGYFMDALRSFNKKGKMHFASEKTIIRPVYSYMGKFIISDLVIKDIAKYIIQKTPEVNKINSIEVLNNEGNLFLVVQIIVNYNDLNRQILSKLQKEIKDEIEKLTYMNVAQVNIVLRSIKV